MQGRIRIQGDNGEVRAREEKDRHPLLIAQMLM